MSRRDQHEPADGAERLSAWFDSELGEVEGAEARRRLRDDPAARAQVQEWRAISKDLQDLQPEALAPERLERLRQSLAQASIREAQSLDRAVRLWSMAAALLLVIGATWFTGLRWVGQDPDHAAYAHEPRDIERAIEELLAPPAQTEAHRPQSGTATLPAREE
jgi:anti-sigma factor RsiW